MPEKRVPVDHLQVGVFIRLELKWYEHPFFLSSFKIKSPDQIETLKELGLTHVIYVPEKSDQQPKPPPQKPEAGGARLAPPNIRDSLSEKLWKIKKERIARHKERNLQIQHCEKNYERSCAGLRKVMQSLATGSEEAVAGADELVQNMVETFLQERELIVHLMNVKVKDEGIFYHVMNVALLAMLLGKEHGLTAREMRLLGMGALFHDIGKARIPKKTLYKRPPLTPAERKLLELHPVYGEEMLGKVEDFPIESLEVIRQHHETNDGKGYPDRLRADSISVLAKITAIANIYDNLCNPLDPEEAMTPHEALSYMFSQYRGRLDANLLALFIKCLGVYPPGTIVQLSNDLIGMVTSMNTKNQLKPSLLIYDSNIPRNEAMVFDMMEDPDVSILKSIRPSQLPAAIYAYLNPRAQVSYYIESPQGSVKP
jgi:putative nucleotidyltransferase with HDIG domain